MKRFLVMVAALVVACSDATGVVGVQPTNDAAMADAAAEGDAAPCAACTTISPAVGWQDGNDWITLTGSGFVSGMKVFFGDGRAPVLVRNGTTAIAQTPPGTGVVDVRIEIGSTQKTLPKAFTYKSGAVKTVWNDTPMQSNRGRETALGVLQDGHVLVAGGVTGTNGYFPDTATDSAEIFDRKTRSFTLLASKMSTVRWFPAAVTLLDGRVLVVGGACWQYLTNCYGDPTKADIYDPATGKFTETKSPLNMPRVFVRAVLLTDGRVLLTSSNDPSLEIYDPTTDSFTLVTTTPSNNAYGFVVRLRDGRVLIGGGIDTAAQIFDSDTNTLTATTGSLTTQRNWPDAHTLPDGRVIVIAGAYGACCNWTPLPSIELFDPTTNTFSVAPYALNKPRFEPGSALVRDGTILVIGGFTVAGQCDSGTETVEQVDPVKGTVTWFTAFAQAKSEVSAITLSDGSVLVAGGGGCGAGAQPDADFLEDDPSPN